MRINKKTGFVAAAALSLLVAGIANATWLSSGAGSGSAQATSADASVISADVFVGDLYPDADKTVTVKITNPNDYPVVVTDISAGTSAALLTPACAAATVTSDARTDGAGFGLTQSDGTTLKIGADSFGLYTLDTHMVANPDNGCQGRTFTFSLTASVESAAHI